MTTDPYHALLLCGLLFFSSAANAEQRMRVPAELPDEIEAAPVTGVLPVTYRSMLGFTLGKHSLGDVTARLGKAPIIKERDAEGRPNSVCYRADSPGDDTVVVFEAGALGGYKTLTAVTVARLNDFSGRPQDCPASKRVSIRLAATGDLRIGGDIENVATVLKARAERSRSGLIALPFEMTGKVRVRGKVVDSETSSGVVALTSDRSIVWFRVYFVESL